MRLTADQQKVLLAKYGVCANDACDKCGKGLCEFRESRLNLAICPSELVALDPNAEMLWPKLLRAVVVTVSKREHIEEGPRRLAGAAAAEHLRFSGRPRRND
jgi:hypothetical protein